MADIKEKNYPSPQEIDAETRLAQEACARGEYKTSAEHWSRAALLAERAGDSAKSLQYRQSQGDMFVYAEKYDEAEPVLRRVLASDPPRLLEARARGSLALLELWGRSRYLAALEEARTALRKLWRTPGEEVPRVEADTLILLGLISKRMRRTDQAIGFYSQAIRKTQGATDRILDGLHAVALLNRAALESEIGQGALALEDVDEARRIYQRLGQPPPEAKARGITTWAYYTMGRIYEARRSAEGAWEEAQKSPDPKVQAFALEDLVELDLLAGELDCAAERADLFVEAAVGAKDPLYSSHAYEVRSRIQEKRGDLVRALQDADRAIAEAEASPADRVRLAFGWAQKASVLGRTGALEEAEAFARKALQETWSFRRLAGRAFLVWSELALARGDRKEALRRSYRSLQSYRRAGFVPGIFEARLFQLGILVRRGHYLESAQKLLDFAGECHERGFGDLGRRAREILGKVRTKALAPPAQDPSAALLSWLARLHSACERRALVDELHHMARGHFLATGSLLLVPRRGKGGMPEVWSSPADPRGPREDLLALGRQAMKSAEILTQEFDPLKLVAVPLLLETRTLGCWVFWGEKKRLRLEEDSETFHWTVRHAAIAYRNVRRSAASARRGAGSGGKQRAQGKA